MQSRFKKISVISHCLLPCTAALLLSGAPALADSPSGAPAYVAFQDKGDAGTVAWKNGDKGWSVGVLSAQGANTAFLRKFGKLNGQVTGDPDGGQNSVVSLKLVPAPTQAANFPDIAEIDLTLSPVAAPGACAGTACSNFYFEIDSPTASGDSYCAADDVYKASAAEAYQVVRSEYKADPDYVITRLGSYRAFQDACGPAGA